MTVNGLPPWFIRNGSGGNEWLPVQHPQPQQALPYEILPFNELPQIVNPPAGWVVNANNDPAGTNLDNDPINQMRPGGGLYYLNRIYDAGFRAGRITDLVREKTANGGKISFADMQEIQGDVVLPDAQYFVPAITNAFSRGQSSGIPAFVGLTMAPGVAEAVRRLSAWRFTAPTGIVQGYDFADVSGQRADPADQEIAESIGATLYSAWRAQFIRNSIDATLGGVPLPPGITLPKPPSQLAMTALKTLFERPVAGVGAAGLNFFNVPGVASAADRRDILILKSLADALALLKSDAFQAAFNNSSNQDDYRWGKLHRIVFDHPLGSPFSIPPAGGAFPPPLAGLKGIPTDGGFGVVDASNHDARANTIDGFMYGSGATNRFVAEGEPWGMRAESVWPGGMSGVLGSPHYVDQLPLWLTNDTIPLLRRQGDLNHETESVEKFVPGK
jgi:penicillin amidase